MINTVRNKIVIGTRSLSGDLGFVSKKQIEKILEKIISCGVNHFDTAPFYGNGKIDYILKNVSKLIIVDTKCGYNSDFTKKTFSTHDIKKSLDHSLSNFNKINIFYLHNPRLEIKNWSRIISLMNSFKEKGLIKFIGISLARNFVFDHAILNEFDYIQDDINILRNIPLVYLRKYSGKIISRSPFATGCLNGSLSKNKKYSRQDYRYSWIKNERLDYILRQINSIKKFYKNDIRKLAIGYLLKKKKIKKIIVGIKKIEHFDFLISSNFNIDAKILKKIEYLNYNNFFFKKNEIGY